MIRIGDAEISRVEESVLDEDPALLPGFGADTLARNSWLAPDFFDEARSCFRIVIQSWILRHAGRTILIDTSGGDDKNCPLSPRFHMKKTGFLDRLRAAGVEPERVDMVVLTHLHVDHVGWNTVLRDGEWVPTFPNAQYVVSSCELEARDPERGAAERPPESWTIYLESVKPVIDAGLMRVVEGDEELLPGLDLVPLPGHAPGMMGLRLRSAGREAMFVADVVHQPIQFVHPQWSSRYCENQEQATETRARVLEHAASEDALLLPSHFAGPHCGRVRRAASGYVFEPPEEAP